MTNKQAGFHAGLFPFSFFSKLFYQMKTCIPCAMVFLFVSVQMPAQSFPMSLPSLTTTITENGPDSGFDKESAVLCHAGRTLDKTVTASVKSFVITKGLTILVLALVALTGICWAVFLTESSKLMSEGKKQIYKGGQARINQKPNPKPGKSGAVIWSNNDYQIQAFR